MRSPIIHFIVALAIGVMAIIGYGAWYSTVSQKSSEVASLQDQITTEGENMKRISAARAALAQIAGDEAAVQSYFVAESSVVAFINALETLGKAQKTTVSVLSVSKGGTPARPTLILALSIDGTFDAVMRTLGAIEYAPYDITVPSVTVGQGDKTVWHANLNLIVGSVPLKAAPSAP